jgi:peptidoglycan/xylan/chitin deacetylase (PgdA/CDA1 family)
VRGAPTLVITWHAIRAGPPPLCVAPEELARQLDLLLWAGLEPRPLRDLLEPAAGPVAGARFCATFDDGYRDFVDNALPLLEARGVPATVFVTASEDRSGVPGGVPGPLLPLDELAGLAARGVAVGAHGLSHVPLTGLDAAALGRELAEARCTLGAWAGQPVDLLAYPFGAFDARVRAAAAAAGFRGAFTTQLAAVPPACDPLAVPRVDAHYLRSPVLDWLIARGWPRPYLFLRRWLRRARGSEPRRAVPRLRPPASGLGAARPR